MNAATPDPEFIKTVLAMSDERDMWERVALRREREALRTARAEGYQAGREAVTDEQDAEWRQACKAVARSGASHTDLEEWRWGSGGREHFGDPRPGDYRGGRADAHPDGSSWAGQGYSRPGPQGHDLGPRRTPAHPMRQPRAARRAGPEREAEQLEAGA
jgi:hypothetical protein